MPVTRLPRRGLPITAIGTPRSGIVGTRTGGTDRPEPMLKRAARRDACQQAQHFATQVRAKVDRGRQVDLAARVELHL